MTSWWARAPLRIELALAFSGVMAVLPAGTGHELRTPLAILRTQLELALRGRRTQQELEDAVRSAAEETERLNELADDLLVIARSDQAGGRCGPPDSTRAPCRRASPTLHGPARAERRTPRAEPADVGIARTPPTSGCTCATAAPASRTASCRRPSSASRASGWSFLTHSHLRLMAIGEHERHASAGGGMASLIRRGLRSEGLAARGDQGRGRALDTIDRPFGRSSLETVRGAGYRLDDRVPAVVA